jgi:hypothetical protein
LARKFALCSSCLQPHAFDVASFSDSPLDRLWKEYSAVFRDFDDMTLARWTAQTLGQLEGRSWRLSHPLLGAYRLASQIAHDRQIWFKRLATPPAAYPEAACCRAPLLPLLTRDVLETGLTCQHCGDTCVPFEELTSELQQEIRSWAEKYSPVHAVAHWDDAQRKRLGNYNTHFEEAARKAEVLLGTMGHDFAPRLLEHFPASIWEDQDECLEVRPEDVEL